MKSCLSVSGIFKMSAHFDWRRRVANQRQLQVLLMKRFPN